MTGCDEKKVPFDYNAHIAIKDILTTQFRTVAEFNGKFQGVDIETCEKCMVEGYSAVGIPFQFQDLTTDELRCYIHRMGIKVVPIEEINDMAPLFITEVNGVEELLCGHCSDEVEELDT